MIESARTSVLQALVERATKLGDCQLSVLSVSPYTSERSVPGGKELPDWTTG